MESVWLGASLWDAGRSSLRGSSKIPGEDNASLMMKQVSAN